MTKKATTHCATTWTARSATWRDNPDRAEILADLEQAIGDKCRACLGAHKTVVSADEIQRILAEMGPVEGSASVRRAPARRDAPAPQSAWRSSGSPFPRRMYRLPRAACGPVCAADLAAYFGIDVVWVRVAFVLLTIFTGGVWILIYIAMCFIVPMAETAEERAAAYGAPFNAQELINRVKKNSSEFRYRGPRMSRGPRMGRAPHGGRRSRWQQPGRLAPSPPGLRGASHRRNPAARDDGDVCSLVCRAAGGRHRVLDMHMAWGSASGHTVHHGWTSGPPHWVASWC